MPPGVPAQHGHAEPLGQRAGRGLVAEQRQHVGRRADERDARPRRSGRANAAFSRGSRSRDGSRRQPVSAATARTPLDVEVGGRRRAPSSDRPRRPCACAATRRRRSEWTATVRSPSSDAARRIRMAISPRLATNNVFSTAATLRSGRATSECAVEAGRHADMAAARPMTARSPPAGRRRRRPLATSIGRAPGRRGTAGLMAAVDPRRVEVRRGERREQLLVVEAVAEHVADGAHPLDHRAERQGDDPRVASKSARPSSRSRSRACTVLACRASRVSSHAVRTARSEIEVSSIRLIMRADVLYARRYCSMPWRTASATRAGALQRAHLAGERDRPARRRRRR